MTRSIVNTDAPVATAGLFLIHHYLEYHAARMPNADAMQCGDDRLSYAQLDQAASQLACALINSGVTSGDRIGIYMPKSRQMPVAVYGILKAGAAFVPLDPTASASRIAGLIQDCDIKVLISHPQQAKQLEQITAAVPYPLVIIGDLGCAGATACIHWSQVAEYDPSELAAPKIIDSDLAYIIYTSGSTGPPKGIMHSHHSCLSFSRWAAHEYQLCISDRVANPSPLHFDISIFDYFATVVAGGCVVLVAEEYPRFPASYADLLAQQRISVLFTVPFALIQLLLRGSLEQHDLGALRWIIFGGEPFPVKYLSRLIQQLPQCRFDNMYGPAEINGCTHHTISGLPDHMACIPIGKVSAIAQSLIVDEDDQPVATGQIGELLVRTPTMMLGYWHREDLNRNAFYRSTLGNGVATLFYRTGDLVRQDSDGNLRFIGRKDRQVKLRGYRIELDEIEAAVVSHPGVEEGAVFVIRQDELAVQIHAAYTRKASFEADPSSINQRLKRLLPPYAVPSVIKPVGELPRTTSGKIDRNVLRQQAEHGGI